MNRAKVGHRLRNWLIDSDMTINDLAMRLAATSADVDGWIRGSVSISFDQAEQICDLLGKTLDELACREKG